MRLKIDMSLNAQTDNDKGTRSHSEKRAVNVASYTQQLEG